ncbi:MAG: hypothetical protein QXF45_06210 [Candidatus Caldarchaeum sp.]
MSSNLFDVVEGSPFWPFNTFPTLTGLLPILLLLAAAAQTFAFIQHLRGRAQPKRVKPFTLVGMNVTAPVIIAITMILLYLLALSLSQLIGFGLENFVYVQSLVFFVAALYPSFILKPVERLGYIVAALSTQALILWLCYVVSSASLSTVAGFFQSFIANQTASITIAMLVHVLFRYLAPWAVGSLIAIIFATALTIIEKMVKNNSS